MGGGGRDAKRLLGVAQTVDRLAVPTHVECDVLLRADRVGNGSGVANTLYRHLPELRAVVRAIDREGLADSALHQEVAGGRQHAARAGIRVGNAEGFFLRGRIPCEQVTLLTTVGDLLQLLAQLGVARIAITAVRAERYE